MFWNDSEESFREELHAVVIKGVALLDMSDVSVFETKKRIELDEPSNQFLLYFPQLDYVGDIVSYKEI